MKNLILPLFILALAATKSSAQTSKADGLIHDAPSITELPAEYILKDDFYITEDSDSSTNLDISVEKDYLFNAWPMTSPYGLRVEANGSIDNLTFLDFSGNVVLSIPNADDAIDLSSLKAGKYFVIVTSGSYHKRLIISK